MSYTQAKVSWEQCNTSNNSIMDEYGDITRKESVIVIARKQPHEEVIVTPEGKNILTKSIYYLDPAIEPNALSINKFDKLDGEEVYSKYEMRTRSNKVRMVRYITI